jgi:hypothetical protein
MARNEIVKSISTEINGVTYHGSQRIHSNGQTISCKFGSETDTEDYEDPVRRDIMAEMILESMITAYLQKPPRLLAVSSG